MKIIYVLMLCIGSFKINSTEIEMKELIPEKNIHIHQKLEKSKLGAVLYTAIPFSVFTIFSVIVNVVFAHQENKGKDLSSRAGEIAATNKNTIKCIGTTIIVLAADIAIKLFTNYYGKLSLFFRPMKFIAVTIPMNLIVSPVSILFVLVLLQFDQINKTLFDNLIPLTHKGIGIVVNRVFIGIGALVYIAVCNLILPIVLHSVNHKKHFLYKKQTYSYY